MKGRYIKTQYREYITESHTTLHKLYHGSDKYFDNFELRQKDSDGFNAFGHGLYFVDNISEASNYGKYIYECEVKTNNLFDAHKNIDLYFDMCDNIMHDENMDLTDILIKHGYDSLKINKNYYNVYVIYDKSQVRILNCIKNDI